MTQRQLFSIPKRAIYANYEVLCNMFQPQLIDLSAAEILRINTSEMSKKEMEELLFAENPYTYKKFEARQKYIEKLDQIEEEIIQKRANMNSRQFETPSRLS